MNKKVLSVAAGLSLVAVAAVAARVKDWHDLHKAHEHLKQVIHELERARSANDYDMAGHGAKAEDLARQAESELRAAVESVKHE